MIVFFVTEALLSWMAAMVFEANHVVEDVAWHVADENNQIAADWVQIQIESAQDYAHNHWWTTFLTGSLNYQVVHHIFPHASIVHSCSCLYHAY